MAVVALIKFTQNANTDVPGRAVIGDTSASVVATNGDNTNVVSWEWELLHVPPGSALSLIHQGPNATPSLTFGAPDVPGCYRVRLTVRDIDGNKDIDIRNFGVPLPNTDIIPPPYQGNPLPLPLVAPLADALAPKPDELNFAGQANGWMGNQTQKLLHYALELLDVAGVPTLSAVLAAGNTSGANDIVMLNGQAIKLGVTNPAATGELRLRNNQTGIKWRNADNTGDIGITVDSSNDLLLGHTAGGATVDRTKLFAVNAVEFHVDTTGGTALAAQISRIGTADTRLIFDGDQNPSGGIITVGAPTTGVAGRNLELSGGAGGTGDQDGGSSYLRPGAGSGAGLDGSAGIQDASGAWRIELDEDLELAYNSDFGHTFSTAGVPQLRLESFGPFAAIVVPATAQGLLIGCDVANPGSPGGQVLIAGGEGGATDEAGGDCFIAPGSPAGVGLPGQAGIKDNLLVPRVLLTSAYELEYNAETIHTFQLAGDGAFSLQRFFDFGWFSVSADTFPSGLFINVGTPTTGVAGGSIVIAAGAGGTGNQNGGDAFFKPGVKSGSGVDGSSGVKDTTDVWRLKLTSAKELEYNAATIHTFQFASVNSFVFVPFGDALLWLVSGDSHPAGLAVLVETPTTGIAGGSIFLVAGEGGTGNQLGGDFVIKPGLGSGTGDDGSAGIMDTADVWRLRLTPALNLDYNAATTHTYQIATTTVGTLTKPGSALELRAHGDNASGGLLLSATAPTSGVSGRAAVLVGGAGGTGDQNGGDAIVRAGDPTGAGAPGEAGIQDNVDGWRVRLTSARNLEYTADQSHTFLIGAEPILQTGILGGTVVLLMATSDAGPDGFLITVFPPTTGVAGSSINIVASDGGTGDQTGGSVALRPGSRSGSGANGFAGIQDTGEGWRIRLDGETNNLLYDAAVTHDWYIGSVHMLRMHKTGNDLFWEARGDGFTSGKFTVGVTAPTSGVAGRAVAVIGGTGGTGNQNGGDVYLQQGAKTGSGVDGSAGIKDSSAAYIFRVDQTRYLEVVNATAVPDAPAAGFRIYGASGAAKVRSSTGTITTFGPADPHCPECGLDFVKEWENPDSGKKLSICMWCATEDGGPLAPFIIERKVA